MLLRLKRNSEQPLGPFSVSQGKLFPAQDSVSLSTEKGSSGKGGSNRSSLWSEGEGTMRAQQRTVWKTRKGLSMSSSARPPSSCSPQECLKLRAQPGNPAGGGTTAPKLPTVFIHREFIRNADRAPRATELRSPTEVGAEQTLEATYTGKCWWAWVM